MIALDRKPEIVWSDQQEAIFREVICGRGDVIVNSVAGSGKTTTAEEASRRIPYYLHRATLMCAFNKHIQEELLRRQRAGRIPAPIMISTLHSLGYQALREHFRPKHPDRWLSEYKYDRIADAYWVRVLSDTLPLDYIESSDARADKIAAAELTRLAMLNLSDASDPEALKALSARYGVIYDMIKEAVILKAVPEMIKIGSGLKKLRDYRSRPLHPSEAISFEDMVYLPVALSLPLKRYSLVFVDEFQDLNPCQREMIFAMRSENGRTIFLGDRAQSIYGFMGADVSNFDRIIELTGATQLDLTVSRRCPKSVVALAKEYEPRIESAPDAPEGEVIRTSAEGILSEAFRAAKDAPPNEVSFLILCRINAPLVPLAIALIEEGVAAKIRGRDIGKGLIRLLDHLSEMAGFSFQQFNSFAKAHLKFQEETLEGQPGASTKLAELGDRLACLVAVRKATINEWGEIANVRLMKEVIEDLFDDEAKAVTLSTIHKSKGLEAREVGIVKPELLPHPKCEADWELEQESNLAYVAVTRSLHRLYIAGRFGFEEMREEARDAA